MTQVLITNGDENGGIHPPAKWAEVTHGHIMQMFAGSKAPHSEILEFGDRLKTLLETHHADVQLHVRDGIAKGEYRDDVTAHRDTAVDEIVTLARQYSFGEGVHANRGYLHDRVGNHMATSVAVEHAWHEDRHEGRAHPEHMALFGHLMHEGARAPKTGA